VGVIKRAASGGKEHTLFGSGRAGFAGDGPPAGADSAAPSFIRVDVPSILEAEHSGR